MNKTEKLKNSVFTSLDAINKACKDTSKSWDKQSIAIPVDLFKQVVIRARWKHKTKNKIALDYIKNYNTMLDLFSQSCVESAKSFGTTGISLDYIDKSLQTLKDAMIKGMKE